MKISEAFPSKYLSAADFEEGDETLTIKEIGIEEVGQGKDKEQKLFIEFKGKDKGLICNKTNANTIAKVLGSDDTDDWVGQRITLCRREVEFQGEPMWSIRVSLKKPAATTPSPKKLVADNDGGEDEPAF